jgi:hypothetical protein
LFWRVRRTDNNLNIALSVASTVMLTRVLVDNQDLQTEEARQNLEHATSSIRVFIEEVYNLRRFHPHLDMSPEAFEEQLAERLWKLPPAVES